MHLLRFALRLLAGPLLALCLFCGNALASPVTVQLRVEGSAKTLFEGPITTEGETITTASGKGPHPCDYHHNGSSEGFENEGVVSGTPTTALHDAALAKGLAFDATWFGSGKEKNGDPGDYFVTQLGSDKNEESGSFDSWGFAVNNLTAPVGGCQIALAPGSEVLWAYNYFNLEHKLKLTGPATADLGMPLTVHVIDAQTGAPLAGMAIGETIEGITTAIPGAPSTDAEGNATIVLSHTGAITLKAQGSNAVRSNGVSVCVHHGNDGTCQTTIPAVPGGPPAPVTSAAKIQGIVAGHVFNRRSSPRLLRGEVSVPAGGTLTDVRISLRRQARGRCYFFSGPRGAFVRSRCSTRGFFSVGASLSFSYLLPARLAPGRYSFDIETVSAGGQISTPTPGTSHVVFRVR